MYVLYSTYTSCQKIEIDEIYRNLFYAVTYPLYIDTVRQVRVDLL